MKEITQKLCNKELCREAVSYLITPKPEVSIFVCVCFQFSKPRCQLILSMAELCSCWCPLAWARSPGVPCIVRGFLLALVSV